MIDNSQPPNIEDAVLHIFVDEDGTPHMAIRQDHNWEDACRILWPIFKRMAAMEAIVEARLQ